MKNKFLEKKYLLEQEYMDKMFEEFKKANGIYGGTGNFDEYYNLFIEWVKFKRRAASNYVQLFHYMNEDNDLPINLIAEFNKGYFDTITTEMVKHTEYQPIIISKYAMTMPRDSGIRAYNGELLSKGDEVFVSYAMGENGNDNPNCNSKINDDIDTLVTQTPFDSFSIRPFKKLLDSEKTLFIGTYGSIYDEDCEENLKKILTLYHELSDSGCRNVDYCSETQEDTYLSAIKISSDPLGKKLYRYRSDNLPVNNKILNRNKYVDNNLPVDKEPVNKVPVIKLK